jgi:hypothetical protein
VKIMVEQMVRVVVRTHSEKAQKMARMASRCSVNGYTDILASWTQIGCLAIRNRKQIFLEPLAKREMVAWLYHSPQTPFPAQVCKFYFCIT